MKTLEEFKNEILFREIHLTERSDEAFDKLIENAEFLVKHLKDEPSEGDCSYMLFRKLALRVNERKLLIKLCAELKKKGVWESLQWGSVKSNDLYYEDHFKREIGKATGLMKKLRPYILKYVATWSLERKMIDINEPEFSQYLSGWFLTVDLKENENRI